jgi:AraC-like DNA-binding protein
VSRDDIEAAQKIEGILTDNAIVIPPTIKELSRKVAMSDSKLKKIFKSVYGLPIYEYFQKHRMQKARLMLLSGNYSIKDVGYSLGYSNLSNFTLAFKKEFHKLPSEITKEIR